MVRKGFKDKVRHSSSISGGGGYTQKTCMFDTDGKALGYRI